jgi:hypothetical protein
MPESSVEAVVVVAMAAPESAEVVQAAAPESAEAVQVAAAPERAEELRAEEY